MTTSILESPTDSVLQQDLEELAQTLPLENLKNSTVFITGATGLIGSQIIKMLACANRLSDINIKILAFARNPKKAKALFGNLIEHDAIQLVIGDVSNAVHCDQNVDYIIHGASATSSKFFVEKPVETITTAINGTKNLLDFAKSKQVKAFLYLSSLEVYGIPDKNAMLIKEGDYGYIDPLQVRSSYSESKRMVECLCISYASEYGVPVKIARLSQTFGAGVDYNDGRVFAEFARCVMERKNITLHTAGNTVRTYCYTKDAIAALFFILLRGSIGQAYNVTNESTKCSIREMAELVCNTFPDSGISVCFDIPEELSSYGYNPEMIIALDNTNLRNLGWQATTDLSEMFKRMIKSIQLRTITL